LIDPLAPIEVASVSDPAIDTEKSKLEAYAKTRDPRHLVLKPGERPTLYVLQPIPAAYALDVLENPTFHATMHAVIAFKAACVEIKLPGGGSLRPAEGARVETAFGFRIAGDEWVEAVTRKLGGKRLVEIGMVARRRAQLAEDELGPFAWPAGSAPTG
jgi:hypothetical protein